MLTPKQIIFALSVALVAVTGYLLGHSDGREGRTLISDSHATVSAEVSPTQARIIDTYFPNSENLAADEMRVIACGTGMHTTRAA